MSLQDFMQALQEQDDDVIYSKPPEETIQIIPPTTQEHNRKIENIKIIPPKEEAPKIIKFKLNAVSESTNTTVVEPKTKKPEVIIPPKKVNSTPEVVTQKPVQKIEENREVVENKQVEEVSEQPSKSINTETKRDRGEELFIRSETPLSKKEIWFEYYNKALRSKKNNFVTEKCRNGRFTINEENKFIVLSDYDTYGKDANEILRDSWF